MDSQQDEDDKMYSSVLNKLEYVTVFIGLLYVAGQCISSSGNCLSSGLPYYLFCIGICILLYFIEQNAVVKRQSFLYCSCVRLPRSHGLWCCILLPVCIFASCYGTDYYICSDTYLAVSKAALGLLVFNVFWIQSVFSSSHKELISYVTRILMSIFLFIFLVSYKYWDEILDFPAFLRDSWGLVLAFSLSLVVCELLLHVLLVKSPKNFTLGENIILSQTGAIFLFYLFFNIAIHGLNNAFVGNERFLFNLSEPISELILLDQKISSIVNICFIGCAIFIAGILIQTYLRTTVGFYGAVVVVALGFILPSLYYVLDEDPVTWMSHFLTLKISRLALLGFWSFLSAASFLIIYLQSGSASTIVRKYFHAIALAIYIPGIIWEPELLYLVASLIVGIFVIIESMRVLNIPPMGTVIYNTFKEFVDEKDNGPLVLTHIYLLAGCVLPLWIMPIFRKEYFSVPLVAFSGVLSVGIGDAIASVGGTLFGRHRWPGTKKTAEGTFLSILVQLFFCFGMNLTGENVFKTDRLDPSTHLEIFMPSVNFIIPGIFHQTNRQFNIAIVSLFFVYLSVYFYYHVVTIGLCQFVVVMKTMN